MKKGLLWICLVCVIVTSLAGCSNKPKIDKTLKTLAESTVETAEKYLDNELTAVDAYDTCVEIRNQNQDWKTLSEDSNQIIIMVMDIRGDLFDLSCYDKFGSDDIDRSQKEIIEDLSEHINVLKTELKKFR